MDVSKQTAVTLLIKHLLTKTQYCSDLRMEFMLIFAL